MRSSLRHLACAALAAAAALLTAAPPASATAATPTRAADSGLQFVQLTDWLDADHPLPALPRTTRFRQPHLPPLAPLDPPDPDLRQQCATHADEAASGTGWIKSRFESCHHQPQDLVLVTKGTGEPVGTLQFDEWILGFTYDGSRRVDYVASVENIVVSTEPGQDARTWSINMDFSSVVSGSGGQIVRPSQEHRDDLLGQWNTTPQWTLTYTSPDDTATAPYKVVTANITVALSVAAPGADLWDNPVPQHSNVRFDSAGAVAGKFSGTVFTDAKVVIPFSLTSFPQSARHYDDALHHTERTFPSIIGKSVPGEDRPLHRTLDSGRQTANNDAAVKTCKDVWGPYDGNLLNCDEYPFASTQEGAALGDGNYSARVIDAGDNQAAGRWLNSNYTLNRIIDGDAFYITITP